MSRREIQAEILKMNIICVQPCSLFKSLFLTILIWVLNLPALFVVSMSSGIRGCVTSHVTACRALSASSVPLVALWVTAPLRQMAVALSVHGVGTMCHLASCPVMPCIIPRRRTRYPRGHPYPSPTSPTPPWRPTSSLMPVRALHPSTGRRTRSLITETARTA